MKAKAYRLAAITVPSFAAPWTAAPVAPAAAQQTYELKANPTNAHWGHFSAAIKPVLSIFVQR